MNKSFNQNVWFLSANDWVKLVIIFMSCVRVRVIRNDSLTSEDVRLKAFSGIEAELRQEEYQGFEEGNVPFTKMNGECQNLFDSGLLKLETPRRERVLKPGFTVVAAYSARFEITLIFQRFVARTTYREMIYFEKVFGEILTISLLKI